MFLNSSPKVDVFGNPCKKSDLKGGRLWDGPLPEDYCSHTRRNPSPCEQMGLTITSQEQAHERSTQLHRHRQ